MNDLQRAPGRLDRAACDPLAGLIWRNAGVAQSRTGRTVRGMIKKSCGSEEARAKLPELLEQAHHGVTTVITKRGEPYAALVPVTDRRATRRGSAFIGLRGSGRGLWGSDVAQALATLRDEWE
jgi:prevent-host-death family protein